MVFYGLQKMTLLDFPGKVAATLFTGGCNFRCPFCHNATLVTGLSESATFEEEEILAFLKGRKGLLDGVAVTGGEPLLQKQLPAFLRRVREMGYAVKLDTNGSFPDALEQVLADNLVDYVAMDIKNSPAEYGRTVGIEPFDLAPIEKSISILRRGAADYEFRTTVVKEFHTVESVAEAARWIQGAPRLFLQNFVDSGNLISPGLSAVDKDTLFEMKKAAEAFIPSVSLRGV